MKSIIDNLQTFAEQQPDALIFAFLNATADIVDSYTYRQFHERTNHMAESLRDSGAAQHGQPVLLVYPPGLESLVAFFACVKVGALPVPAPSLDSLGLVGTLEKLAAMAQDCGATVALTTQQHLKQLRDAAARNLDVTAAISTGPLSALDWRPTDRIVGARSDFDVTPASLLFLQYTSGSTQTPRGVMVSHANVLHNCDATVDHRPVSVSWLPHYHDMGLIGYCLFPMLHGGSAYLFASSHFLRRPRVWFEAITRYRATASSGPNFAYEYCLREDRIPTDALRDLDLSTLRSLMNAAEPVRADTYERFIARFEPCGLSRNAFVVYYGLAENTLSVSGGGRIRLCANSHWLEQGRLRLEPPKNGHSSDQTRLMSCGAPFPGIDVRIVDAATNVELGEDLIGEIWVAGASKTEGYWNKAAVTQAVFRSRVDGIDTGTTYLRTGDLGFMHEGELFVCGRIKDMIIAGGRNYYANDVEAVVESASTKVRQGCVAAFAVPGTSGEAVVVLLEARRPNDLPDLDAIARDVGNRCHLELETIAIVPHGAIAKTSSGKIARQECRSHWLQDRIQTIARRDRMTPHEGTRDFIAEFLQRLDAQQDEATLAEIGADSLTLVELCLYFENVAKERGITADDFFDLRALQAVTVGEVKGFLSKTSDHKFLGAQSIYKRRLRSIENEETSRMRRDARLPIEIQVKNQNNGGGNSVLLTGATGFLGSFLLEALLRQTEQEIVVVVRAQDDLHARSRIESALQRTGLWSESLRNKFARRVECIPGDLASPCVGIDQRDWDRLSHQASAIYHCGGEVDYVKPYQSLHGANVSSTLELLRLATTASSKVLHYISTTFVFGFAVRDLCLEADRNLEMAGLNFGYAQTKWVSEQLVHEAMTRGVRARVYRPSFVTASRSGRYVRRDVLARIFPYMIQHEIAPDAKNQLSCLPVDVCANNIVALSLLDNLNEHTFHLTADRYYSIRDFCESITRQYGYRFDYMSFERLVDHLNHHSRQHDPVFPLLPFLNHNFRRIEEMAEKRYVSEAYKHARQLSVATLPEPDLDSIVAGFVTFLQQERLVPQYAHSRVVRATLI